MPEYIWGRNPVLETLHSTRHVKSILLVEGQREATALAAILQEAARRHIPIETVPRARLDQLSPGALHQPCLAGVEARKYVDLEQILAYPEPQNRAPLLLILHPIQQ